MMSSVSIECQFLVDGLSRGRLGVRCGHLLGVAWLQAHCVFWNRLLELAAVLDVQWQDKCSLFPSDARRIDVDDLRSERAR